jgi:AcrR family transcriptional regulator
MRDIADILSVRQAALYYYFSSKEAILEEICRLGITEFVEALRAVAAAPGDFRTRLRRGIAAHLTPLLARRFYVSAFLYSRHILPAGARGPLDSLAQEYEHIWRSMIEEARAAGELAADIDPEIAAFALLGALNAVARRPGIAAGIGVAEAAERFAGIFETGLLAR